MSAVGTDRSNAENSSSFQSSSMLTPDAWEATDHDRLYHDDTSDSASSYYFLHQHRSVGEDSNYEKGHASRREQKTRSPISPMTDWSYGDSSMVEGAPRMPGEEGDYNDNDEDSRNGTEDDSTDSKDDQEDDENLVRIGIQPVYPSDSHSSFDDSDELEKVLTQLEDDESEDDYGSHDHDSRSDRRHRRKHRLRCKRESYNSQDAYWNSNSKSSHPYQSEYSFFSTDSESPNSFWELLRLQTLLGSCYQPRSDSFDGEAEDDITENDDKPSSYTRTSLSKAAAEKKKAKQRKESERKEGTTPSDTSSWVVFGQISKWGFPLDDGKEEEKHEVSNDDIRGSATRKQRNEEQQHDSNVASNAMGTVLALAKTNLKMRNLLVKIRKTTSANVRSVKLAASFATEDAGSILNNTEAKYAKFLEEKEEGKEQDTSDERWDEVDDSAPTASLLPNSGKKLKRKKKEQQEPQPEEPGMLFQLRDQLSCLDLAGCGSGGDFANFGTIADAEQQRRYPPAPSYPSASPSRWIFQEHLTFDDFGVVGGGGGDDDGPTRPRKSDDVQWAQFDVAFPSVGECGKKAINSSYISDTSFNTVTTADETRSTISPLGKSDDDCEDQGFEVSAAFPVFTDAYGAQNQGYHYTGGSQSKKNAKRKKKLARYKQPRQKLSTRIAMGLKRRLPSRRRAEI